MTEITDTAPVDETPAVIETEEAPAYTDAPAEAPEHDTFSRDYVERLRSENASNRVKAKAVDTANARLVQAYAASTGRLQDASDLPYSPDLLDDTGLVDAAKVAEAVDALLTVKPHLTRRTPTAPLPMGVREETPSPKGLFAYIRGEA